MQTLFKDVLVFLNFFVGIYEGIKKLFIPPKAYSWQTFIYLSAFSWFLSFFSVGYVKTIIAFLGWLFLIAGTAWYTTEDPLRVPGTFMPVGALITGFLISVFAFSNSENMLTPRTIILWPTISAIITAIPDFVEGTDTSTTAKIPKPEVREKIIILVGSCMLISCWIQFYFVMDNWLTQYPTLLTDNFERSTFVVRIAAPELRIDTEAEPQPKVQKIPKNGVNILDAVEIRVEKQLNQRPWSEVEKWLLDATTEVGKLGDQVLNQTLGEYEESKLWRVEARVVNIKSGYRLDLVSIWDGPSSNRQGYYLQKSCTVEPIAISQTTSRVTPGDVDNQNTVAEIECDRLSKFIAGESPAKQ
ncbi:septal junction protein FraD [Nodularia harveyana UHCC-0300]|uniref:Septal junction protein FraD n=1 Tax=Nodularia harveyana UHCC-0300 TaxID=2974287 RepID=A0ABU5UBH5_9CYAN|nr:septal junction protein FraD [Nodularia harveyana]MEA5580311.1 septal junction protein FraD [Nodularia harveyana UHCC-0300]